MIERDKTLKNKKKQRIEIRNINDFKEALKKESYTSNDFNKGNLKEKILKFFNEDAIEDEVVTYRADNVSDFIDYVEKIILFKKEHKRLCNKISKIKKLNIDRIEYERQPSIQDNVENIIKSIEEIKSSISRAITREEMSRLDKLENEISKNYLYAKDVELLKKILLTAKENIKEIYDVKTKVKRVSIEISKDMNYDYIPVKSGTVEYHHHLTNNIPRMQRLIKNMHKYIKVDKEEREAFRINQSKALQDSINIAVATYDNKEFKAISGSNNIINYCVAPILENAAFKSSKVNKLGKLGIGYNRVNDSEKKIFEEIHKQIEEKILRDDGEVILYSKWEPCPSCYFVISQFCKRYPRITVQVKYGRRYGEL